MGPTRQPWRGDSLNMAAVTGPGETTAPKVTTNENMKTAASESVDKFANERTKRHFTGGECSSQESVTRPGEADLR